MPGQGSFDEKKNAEAITWLLVVKLTRIEIDNRSQPLS
jgi:hypothetical protein